MVFFFFFKQKTAYEMRISDWSSDVCSSDLTDNLEQRIAQHQSGEIAGYTQKRRPVSLVWQQDFGTSDEAISAEQQIKGWSRKKKEALIAGNWDMISQLARKAFDTELRQAQPLPRTNDGMIEPAPPPVLEHFPPPLD